MTKKANKWLLSTLITSGSLVALASFYVAYDMTREVNISENSPIIPTIEKQTEKQIQSVKPLQEQKTVKNTNNFIEENFIQLGNFVKTQGKWYQNALLISDDGDITYRSDKDQMSITFKNASFGWNENKPKEISDPTADFMDMTIAWPMVDPHFAEMDDFWDVVGVMNIKEGRIRIVHALNEAQEITQFSFKELKQELGEDYIGRTLDTIMKGIYDLSVNAMLDDTLEQTKKTAENFLYFLMGMPVTIGNLEGDIKTGDLIFENINIGSSDNPLMTFASGKIKYNIDRTDPKKTQLIVDNLELFEPTAYVKFSEEINPDGQPNENILPVLQRITEQYEDLYNYNNRLYIPITYKNIQVGDGVIVTTQKDEVKRTQIPKLEFNQEAFRIITEAGTSPTYGLIGGYLGNLGQASLMVISELQNTNNSNAPASFGLDNAIDERLGLTQPEADTQ